MTTRRQSSNYKIGRRRSSNTTLTSVSTVAKAWAQDESFIVVGSKKGLAADIAQVIHKILAEQKNH